MLTATFSPVDTINKSVTWHPSNENTATVKGGVVMGVVTITVITEDGGKTALCEVTVTDDTDKDDSDTGGNGNTGGEGAGGSSGSTGGNSGNMMEKTEISAKN